MSQTTHARAIDSGLYFGYCLISRRLSFISQSCDVYITRETIRSVTMTSLTRSPSQCETTTISIRCSLLLFALFFVTVDELQLLRSCPSIVIESGPFCSEMTNVCIFIMKFMLAGASGFVFWWPHSHSCQWDNAGILREKLSRPSTRIGLSGRSNSVFSLVIFFVHLGFSMGAFGLDEQMMEYLFLHDHEGNRCEMVMAWIPDTNPAGLSLFHKTNESQRNEKATSIDILIRVKDLRRKLFCEWFWHVHQPRPVRAEQAKK